MQLYILDLCVCVCACMCILQLKQNVPTVFHCQVCAEVAEVFFFLPLALHSAVEFDHPKE